MRTPPAALAGARTRDAMRIWTLAEIAQETPWPLDRTLAVPGRLRGNALRAWGLHVDQRFGAGAADRVREHLRMTPSELPDQPTKKHWYPVSLQQRLVRFVVDELLGGDALAFESVFEESTGTAEKALVLAGRVTGPGLVLRMAGSYHASVCDVGRCLPDVSSGKAILDFRDADVFEDPTWRFANMVSMKTMFGSLKRNIDLIQGEEHGPRSFLIRMHW
jgi:hypothetical protein